MRTQIDLHDKNLFMGKVEKVKVVGSHSRMEESNYEEKENYLNNQGVLGPMAKETKVGSIKERIIMIMQVIEIVTNKTRILKVTEVDCIYLLGAAMT